MVSKSESVRVTICGDEYSIKTDVDIETTKKVADMVSQKMMEIKKGSSIRDNAKIADLSALNIAGERDGYKGKCAEVQKNFSKLKEKADNLLKKIDLVLRES